MKYSSNGAGAGGEVLQRRWRRVHWRPSLIAWETREDERRTCEVKIFYRVGAQILHLMCVILTGGRIHDNSEADKVRLDHGYPISVSPVLKTSFSLSSIVHKKQHTGKRPSPPTPPPLTTSLLPPQHINVT